MPAILNPQHQHQPRRQGAVGTTNGGPQPPVDMRGRQGEGVRYVPVRGGSPATFNAGGAPAAPIAVLNWWGAPRDIADVFRERRAVADVFTADRERRQTPAAGGEAKPLTGNSGGPGRSVAEVFLAHRLQHEAER